MPDAGSLTEGQTKVPAITPREAPRLGIRGNARLAPAPVVASNRTSPAAARTMSTGLAPNACRIASSRVRAATLYETRAQSPVSVRSSAVPANRATIRDLSRG